MNIRWLVPATLILALAACSSAPQKPGGTASAGSKPGGTVVQGGKASSRPAHCPDGSPYAAAAEDLATRGNYTAGGLYKPGVKDTTPTYIPNVACIPEPLVEDLARSAIGNKTPYEVLGKKYKVMDSTKGYAEKGTASYYGAKFHGRLTSNREVYDMYQFTAAHKTLPLPSFARVTNMDNGESVIVRVNDRGPFHDGRVIDLSYAAAVRLGITQRGTGNVEVRALQPGEGNLLAAAKPTRAERREVAAAAAAAPAAAAPSAIDGLVNRLPAKPATVAATTGPEAYRYRVADSAKPGSADNFDRWMRENKVSVATGKPAAVVASAAPAAGRQPSAATAATVVPAAGRQASTATATSVVPAAGRQSSAATAATVVPAAGRQPSTATAASVVPAAGRQPNLSQQVLGSVLLQVASFASRDNATRAQGQLTAAGIAGASITDIATGGRTLWRLRVPASDHASASELAGRIAGLGFGAPQIVKE